MASKVKFFSDSDLERLEDAVNSFIEKRDVLDIKLSESNDDWTCVVVYKGSTPSKNEGVTGVTSKGV